MCDSFCNEWVEKASAYWTKEAFILDVGMGGLAHNGKVKEICERTGHSYLGTDMQGQLGVDLITKAENLLEHFKPQTYNVVISTEMLEHCELWREAIYNMLSVLKVGGILVLTTRSPGFIWHEYPWDYWRFTVGDLKRMFLGVSEVLHTDVDRPEGGPGCGIILRRTSEDLEEWQIGLRDLNVYDMRTEK